MILARLLSIPVLLALSSAATDAADLTKIERRIGREPAYRSKPNYCLLVVGPEARMRIWLVQDGDTLYVDRNGNGDLTEPGERVAAEKRKDRDPDDRNYTFAAGELREGGRRHLNLFVYASDLNPVLPEAKALLERDAQARHHNIQMEVELPGYQGLGAGGASCKEPYRIARDSCSSPVGPRMPRWSISAAPGR